MGSLVCSDGASKECDSPSTKTTPPECDQKNVPTPLSWFHTRMVVASLIRDSLGCDEYGRIGHFVDHELTAMIHRLSFWLDYPTGNTLMNGHQKWVNGAAISPNGRNLYSCSMDYSIRHWDLLQGRMEREWAAPVSWAQCIACSSDCIASGGNDFRIYVFDADSTKRTGTLIGHTGKVTVVQFTQDSRRVISGSEDSEIRVWCLQSNQCLRQFTGHITAVTSVLLTSDRVVSSAKDGRIQVSDLNSGSTLRVAMSEGGRTFPVLSLNCNRSLLMSSSFCFWKWPELELLPRRMDGSSSVICAHPCHPHVFAAAFGGPDYRVSLYDCSESDIRCIESFFGHSYFISCLLFTSDGTRLISTSFDWTIRMWEISK